MSSNVLSALQPHQVWSIFEGICGVPRPSKHEERIRAWILNFAKENNIEAVTDRTGNIILRKPATASMENRKGVVLQSHMDMVPQKNSDTTHDFMADAIKPRIENGWVKATGTTLGADNAIGLSASLAVLASNDLVHGPLECLITYDEETGMTGAFELEPGLLKGDILINLDSEDHGEIFIGCAGGVNTIATLPYTEEATGENMQGYKLAVKGLLGGHSGLDIHLGRGNANKVMNRLLAGGIKEYGVRIASVNGGSLRNAIPRESFATVAVPAKNIESFQKYVNDFLKMIKNELASTDANVDITAEETEAPAFVMDLATQSKFINAVYACPNGVYGMSADMPGLVETSNNLAIIKTGDKEIYFETLQRSSVESQKEDVMKSVAAAFELAGAKIEHSGDYPGWKPNIHSEILEIMQTVFKTLYASEPKLQAVHAGLECGLLGRVYPHWDMISFGPTIRSPHSPDERVNIESVNEFWNYLVETLKNVPER